MQKSSAKSEYSRLSLYDQMQAFDSIWNNKGVNDSILTIKDANANVAPGNKAVPPPQGSLAQQQPSDWPHQFGSGNATGFDYDPLYTESACANPKWQNQSNLEAPEGYQPVSNSKPLLVSELVSNYKGINTASQYASESNNERSKVSMPREATQAMKDYADTSLN